MVLETTLIPFAQWILPALLNFVATLAIVGCLFLVAGYLISAFRYGPVAGGDITFGVVKSMAGELLHTSPRRIWALARLAVQEAIRRRVLAAFGVFLVVLLFAGWFLDPSSNDPARLFLSFVMNLSRFLILVIALLVSAFSLPTDLKNKTIFTVVTKPVRAGEIVLGRIVGFTLVCTAMLALMGLFSYVFVVRLLSHEHQIAATHELPAPGKNLQTSTDQNHHHDVLLSAEGEGQTDTRQGHHHAVTSEKSGDKVTYSVGPPEGTFSARVPVYGTLKFLDRNGEQRERGINVGNEWTYRTFIEGRTRTAGVFSFSGVKESDYPDGYLPVAMTIRVFRTYKGDIVSGIRGSLQVRNPDNENRSELIFFTAKDATSIDVKHIPQHLTDPSGKKSLDLFKDLVTRDGRVEIWVSCLDPAQYYGLAQADLWLQAGDASFPLNFIKGYYGIWLQMVLAIGFGVMFSTFLNGIVAVVATIVVAVLGGNLQFISDLVSGKAKGGGPLESMIRIFNQQNMVVEMEGGITRTVVQNVDIALLFALERIAMILPDISYYDNSLFVASGFNIPGDLLLEQTCSALAYVVGVFLIGYFFLKTREVAR